MTTTLRRLAAVLATPALLIGSAFVAQSASADPAPYVAATATASPSCGPTGSSGTVTGNGFTPGATGTISFNGTSEHTFTVSGGSATDSGRVSTPFSVPSGASGTATITLTDSAGVTASTPFSVGACNGTGGVTVSNPSPTAGQSITVSGTSCTPGATVTVTLDGTTVLGTTTAKSDGSYSVVVTIPSGTSAGSHTITASGPGNGCSGVEAVSVSASGSGGGLAGTGVAVVGLGALGVVLLIGGGLMLMAGRRRKLTLV